MKFQKWFLLLSLSVGVSANATSVDPTVCTGLVKINDKQERAAKLVFIESLNTEYFGPHALGHDSNRVLIDFPGFPEKKMSANGQGQGSDEHTFRVWRKNQDEIDLSYRWKGQPYFVRGNLRCAQESELLQPKVVDYTYEVGSDNDGFARIKRALKAYSLEDICETNSSDLNRSKGTFKCPGFTREQTIKILEQFSGDSFLGLKVN